MFKSDILNWTALLWDVKNFEIPLHDSINAWDDFKKNN